MEKNTVQKHDQLASSGSSGNSFLNLFEKIVTQLNRITHGLSMIVLFGMMLLTTFDVIGRSFLKRPIPSAFELTGIALLVMIFFSLGYTQIKGDHISINFLTSKFSQRTQAVILVIFTSAMVVLVMLTAWQLILYANRLANQTLGDLSLPLSPFAIVASIGIFFFALTLILTILQSAVKGVKRDES